MGDNFKTPLKGHHKKLLDSVQIPASPFLKKIGFGTGVAVYELQRSPVCNKLRSPWAIKKLLNRYKNDEVALRLCEEAQTLRKLSHPNIVGFRAFIKGDDGRNILAMEECHDCLGDMIEERRENDEGPFAAKLIEKMAQDIASALDYLHNTALLLHCDLKSYNVLIKGDFEICKLCDFGVCLPLMANGKLDLEKAGEEPEYTGTLAWSAPEIVDYPQKITTKADIYAFGLIIWEMIALIPPVDDEMMDSMDESGDSIKISPRVRPPLPYVDLSDEYSVILEIYYCCTHEDYKQRPSAKNLVAIFSQM